MTQTQNTSSAFTIKDPTAPATPAQLSYLADLVKNRDLPVVAQRYQLISALGTLNKGLASEWIDQLVKSPKKATAATKTFTVPEVNSGIPAAVVNQLTTIPAYGYYEIDGAFYYWDVTGKDNKPTLRRLKVVTNYDGTKKGSWKIVFGAQTAVIGTDAAVTKAQKVTATYVPYAGKGWNKAEVTTQVWVPGILVAAALKGQIPLTQEQAAAKGKAVGFCIRCGATLTDPISVANGIGPVCAKYWA